MLIFASSNVIISFEQNTITNTLSTSTATVFCKYVLQANNACFMSTFYLFLDMQHGGKIKDHDNNTTEINNSHGIKVHLEEE